MLSDHHRIYLGTREPGWLPKSSRCGSHELQGQFIVRLSGAFFRGLHAASLAAGAGPNSRIEEGLNSAFQGLYALTEALDVMKVVRGLECLGSYKLGFQSLQFSARVRASVLADISKPSMRSRPPTVGPMWGRRVELALRIQSTQILLQEMYIYRVSTLGIALWRCVHTLHMGTRACFAHGLLGAAALFRDTCKYRLPVVPLQSWNAPLPNCPSHTGGGSLCNRNR